MVLYAIYHGAHLSLAISHRLVKNCDKKAVFLVGNGRGQIGNTFNNFQSFADKGILDNLAYFNAAIGLHQESIEEVEIQIETTLDNIFKAWSHALADFSEIYIYTDHLNPLAIYFALKGRTYHHIEDLKDTFVGRRSAETAYKTLHANDIPYRETLKKHNAWGGFSELCIPHVHPNSKNLFEGKKNFLIEDAYQMLIEVDDVQKRNIIDCFSNNIELPSDMSTLYLLTGDSQLKRARGRISEIDLYTDYSNIGWHKQIILLWQLSIDYFLTNEEQASLLLKAHPSLPITDKIKNDYLNASEVFPHGFPAELLKWLKDFRVKTVFSTNTTATLNLPESSVGRFCSTGGGFYYCFHYFNKVHFSLEIAALIRNHATHVFLIGFGGYGVFETINNYSELCFPSLSLNRVEKGGICKRHNSIILLNNIDNIETNEIIARASTLNSVVIVVDTKDEFMVNPNFADEFCGELSTLKIYKKAVKDNVIMPTKTEHLYVFFQNKKIVTLLNGFHKTKILPFTGIELSCFPVQRFQDNVELTVIVPVYNRLDLIERCLKSITNSTLQYSRYELVVVDDCSTDGTYEYCLKLADSSQANIRVLKTENNSGSASVPRNIGIDSARGKYLFFVDSDDYIADYTLQTGLDYCFDNDSDYCGVKVVRSDGGIGRVLFPDIRISSIDLETVDAGIFALPCKFIRTALVRSIDLKIATNFVYCEDASFNIVFSAYCTKISYLYDRDYYFRDLARNFKHLSTDHKGIISETDERLKYILEELIRCPDSIRSLLVSRFAWNHVNLSLNLVLNEERVAEIALAFKKRIAYMANYLEQITNDERQIFRSKPLFDYIISGDFSKYLNALLNSQLRHTDFKKYISVLYKYRGSLIVFITVNDTPCSQRYDKRLEVLKSLGCEINLNGKFRSSYIAVIDSGQKTMEMQSAEKITISLKIAGENVVLISCGKVSTGFAGIRIGESEYAVNQRGINIVVYNKYHKVIDSVCFDGFHNLDCYRKKENIQIASSMKEAEDKARSTHSDTHTRQF